MLQVLASIQYRAVYCVHCEGVQCTVNSEQFTVYTVQEYRKQFTVYRITECSVECREEGVVTLALFTASNTLYIGQKKGRGRNKEGERGGEEG